MKKMKMIVADNDSEYINRLFSALEGKYPNFDLTLADKASFGELVSRRLYDVALFDASVYTPEINLKNIKLPVLLLDEESSESLRLANSMEHSVIKYQQVDKIYREIIARFSERPDPDMYPSKGISSVIGFYSPAGGTGKTTVAIAACEMMANRRSRVLYISLEDIACYGALMGAKPGKGLDEIIYQLDKHIDMPLKIKSLAETSRSGVQYFNMFSNIMDITEIKEDKMTELLNALMSADICDFIAVDMSPSLCGINKVILERADKIILVVSDDMICREKVSRLTEHKNMFEDYFSRMETVMNKCSPGAAEMPELNVISRIPAISGMDSRAVIDDIVKRGRLDIARLIS